MEVTINIDNLENFLGEYLDNNGSADARGGFTVIDWEDWDAVKSFVEQIVMSNVLTLPDGARGIVHVDDSGGEVGFFFGLTPNDPPRNGLPWVYLTGTFAESVGIEPRDAEGRLPVDGAQFPTALDQLAAVLQVARNVASELTTVVPAYEKLWL